MIIKKIGIFGGTFDPVHLGHLIVAYDALEHLKLDRVFFVPAERSPHKLRARMAPNRQRFQMLKTATAGEKRFCTLDLEIRRGGPSYTFETLETMRSQYPKTQIYLLMGRDTYMGLGNWTNIEGILKIATIVVMGRKGRFTLRRISSPALRERLSAKTIFLKTRTVEISSSEIRRRLLNKRDVAHLLPGKVYRAILRNRLYGA